MQKKYHVILSDELGDEFSIELFAPDMATACDMVMTEYWVRDKQAWQSEKGAHYVQKLLFRKSYALDNLSVTSYKA
jgi:hypothetical protein